MKNEPKTESFAAWLRRTMCTTKIYTSELAEATHIPSERIAGFTDAIYKPLPEERKIIEQYYNKHRAKIAPHFAATIGRANNTAEFEDIEFFEDIIPFDPIK